MDNAPVVLVVEDDVATQALLAAVVRRCNCVVRTAGDGETAMAMILAERPDAVILDLLLPKMNGYEVLRHMRNTVPDLLDRTIVTTAGTALAVPEQGDWSLIRRFLPKPLDPGELADELARCTALSIKRKSS